MWKNTHGSVLLLVKLQVFVCNFTKSNNPPWVFFTFSKFYKWHQIAQTISNALSINSHPSNPTSPFNVTTQTDGNYFFKKWKSHIKNRFDFYNLVHRRSTDILWWPYLEIITQLESFNILKFCWQTIKVFSYRCFRR